ncbi:N4-gp56 family major capsid protein [Streptomyces sp. N35]|uniref:N4-gp56 family major capsid protein n=1 Tax=Streptomyces sp. N35 TaxID=2795730 RepID=UPI0018F57437|nr:N4-gp56 family major capsid protein [Streptomyces sp. N35]
MAVTTFVPQVWGAAVLTALSESLTYGSERCTNRDYDGDVSEYGGSVKITTAGDVTIGDYTAYVPYTPAQASTTTVDLPINQRKFWNFMLDDVDRAQVRNDGDLIGKLSARAAHQLRNTADKYVAAQMAAGVAVGNQIAEQTIAPTAFVDAYDKVLLPLRQKLSDASVPTEGRFLVVTPAFHNLLLKDSRFIAAGDGTSAEVRQNGYVGRAAGFDIFETTAANAPDGPGAGAGKLIVAGHPSATTYAEQISKVEAVRMTDRFTDQMRGLHMYGALVIRPTALATADVVVS